MDYNEATDTERYRAVGDTGMEKYANNILFSNAQLYIIRCGLDCGLDVSIYAHPEIPVNAMMQIFKYLKNSDKKFVVRYRGEAENEVLVYHVTCGSKNEALNRFAKQHSVGLVIDIRDEIEDDTSGSVEVAQHNEPGQLLITYVDKVLVFSHYDNVRVVTDTELTVTMLQAKSLLSEMEYALSRGSSSEAVGPYVVYINRKTRNGIELRILYYKSDSQPEDIGTFTYQGFFGYPSMLGGIISAINDVDRQIAEFKEESDRQWKERFHA